MFEFGFGFATKFKWKVSPHNYTVFDVVSDLCFGEYCEKNGFSFAIVYKAESVFRKQQQQQQQQQQPSLYPKWK